MSLSAQRSIVESSIVRLSEDGSSETRRDKVSVEEPLEIRCNHQRLMVTMRTPGYDEDLVLGYLASEGVIKESDDVISIGRNDVASHPENVIDVTLRDDCMRRIEELERFGTMSTSCGVCGKKTLDTACGAFEEISSDLKVSRKRLFEMSERFKDGQGDFKATGGLHAAALFTRSGEMKSAREDIGRHNAVDKVLGAVLREEGWPLSDLVLMVSGRVSFDIEQKSIAAGIPVVAAVSAPSSLAISLAREKGQMLVGFLRRPTMNVYSHPHRLSE